jgi:hypothetical protein
MFVSEWLLSTSIPKETVLYNTLFIPFDNYIWSLTFLLVLLQMAALAVVEILWHHMMLKHSTPNYIYESKLLFEIECREGHYITKTLEWKENHAF